ncbi:hypothetical protein HOLleu_23301 [Holothuria leucospilota]|uniref:Uncharacterized protein n=1 Tax=Holothuria leucospilota TaxID=206669 RepID=A0A9Q1H5J1_HOLLE|nr:hypothetical protein HOLleu_23301 [Holothuria leucospilota]
MSDDEMLLAQSSADSFSATSGPEVLLSGNEEGAKDEQRTTRPRKRVTFDMQLQIHTIPNRIPVYERRPAYNSMGPPPHYSALLNRTQHQRSILPRPLEGKSRDRYLVGAANLSAKRIIDLFGTPSSGIASSSPTRSRNTTYRNTRRVPQYASPTISSNARLSQTPNDSNAIERQPLMSPAAANLKHITDALGEEQSPANSESKEIGFSRNADKAVISPSLGGRSDQDLFNGLKAPRSRVQSSPARVQNFSFSGSSSTVTTSQPSLRYTNGPERLRSASLATPRPEPLDGSGAKLPSVSSEQIQLSNRYLPGKMIPGKDETMRLSAHGRTDFFKPSTDEYSNETDINGNIPNRTPSRCSTIDAYVIGDGQDQSSLTSPYGITSNAGNRRIGSGRGHRRIITTPPSRAWEGMEMPVTQPSLQVSALRTAVNTPQQGGAISSYLSTSTSQRTWSSRNAYS